MIHRDIQYILDYYRVLQQRIHEQILGEKDEVILHSNAEELLEYYLSNNCLSPIEFDPERQSTFEPKKELRKVPADRRESVYQYLGDLTFEYEIIKVTIPIIPNEHTARIFEMQASTYNLSGDPAVNVGHDALYFSIDIKGYGFTFEDEQVGREVNHYLDRVKQMIGWKNADVNKGNSQLRQALGKIIADRKAKLQADQSRLASLVQKINIPLKQKIPDAVTRIKLDPKPLVKRVKPAPQIPEEYVLDRSKVVDIISVIDNQGRQFEKTPKTYRDFGEEDLRNVILVNINGLFEGKATGETFSNKGKTDIYLNIDKGNVLISECKLWSGQVLYLKTIDQLLGYLTWRHNFGVMITFSKQKNFSKILADAPRVITQHPSYRSGFQQINANHFMSTHALPHDETKSVEIHHLFYNLFTE